MPAPRPLPAALCASLVSLSALGTALTGAAGCSDDDEGSGSGGGGTSTGTTTGNTGGGTSTGTTTGSTGGGSAAGGGGAGGGSSAVCGDGVVAGAEVCDDGNTADGDYCAADCTAVTGSCGDGVLQGNEGCDDGVVMSGCDSLHDGGDGACVPAGTCSPGYLLAGTSCVPELAQEHVHIDVDNFCNMSVTPVEYNVPAGQNLKLSYHNHSVDYPVDVWKSYGGGFLDLQPGMTWDEQYEHCAGPQPSTAYADISTACSSFRLYIHCL
ncbi:MAG: DUF4215 domain-containing protein [Polyangiaceae bacterium]|nr:DUF4215 domain-containing protein [Polyangiaceae bacterium]